MIWRNENKMDEILEWEPPEDLKKACPYEISFQDHSARPVLLFPWARWTPWDFTDNGRRDEYLKYMYIYKLFFLNIFLVFLLFLIFLSYYYL
jgi:hypothetical protein